jgi:hypothetical protein
VSALIRWRLARPLIFLSLMCLTAVVIAAWVYWAEDTAAERALSVFLGVRWAAGTGPASGWSPVLVGRPVSPPARC